MPTAASSHQSTSVSGRAVTASGGDTKENGSGSGVLPPDPLSAGGDQVPAGRSVQQGGVENLRRQGVKVDAGENCHLVDISIPDAKHPAVFPVKAILDSGAGMDTISEGVAGRLQSAFPDVRVVKPLDPPSQLKLADGTSRPIAATTCPARLAVHTNWGPVVVPSTVFAIMPGNDDAVILGRPTLRALNVDLDQHLQTQTARFRGVESSNLCASRRVTLSIDALRPHDLAEPPDEAVERLVSRGPDMIMSPAQEESGRAEALDNAVQSAAAAGLSPQGVGKLHSIVDRRRCTYIGALRPRNSDRVQM